jgi:hypothetical protein
MKDALPFREIPTVYLFEPKINLAKIIVVNNLLLNQNLMFSLNLQKRNLTEMKMVDDLLVIGQNIY